MVVIPHDVLLLNRKCFVSFIDCLELRWASAAICRQKNTFRNGPFHLPLCEVLQTFPVNYWIRNDNSVSHGYVQYYIDVNVWAFISTGLQVYSFCKGTVYKPINFLYLAFSECNIFLLTVWHLSVLFRISLHSCGLLMVSFIA